MFDDRPLPAEALEPAGPVAAGSMDLAAAAAANSEESMHPPPPVPFPDMEGLEPSVSRGILQEMDGNDDYYLSAGQQ